MYSARIAHLELRSAFREVVLEDRLLAMFVGVIAEIRPLRVTINLGWGAATGTVVVAFLKSAEVLSGC